MFVVTSIDPTKRNKRTEQYDLYVGTIRWIIKFDYTIWFIINITICMIRI